MLSIKAKVEALVEEVKSVKVELDAAIYACDDLIGTLKNCKESELPERVGIFARQMPDWKHLSKEREGAIEMVRKICTKELSVEQGINILEKFRWELENTRNCIKL